MRSQRQFQRTTCRVVALILWTVLVQTICSVRAHHDRYAIRKSRDIYETHRLVSHVIATRSLGSALDCFAACLNNCFCISFNYCAGERKCELNSAKKADDPGNYKTNNECTYHEITWEDDRKSQCNDKTICTGCCKTSTPCSNGGTCQAVDDTDGQRYRCTCRDGYRGQRCEHVPRSCADYAQSHDRANGIHVIYASDNTTSLKVMCHFDEQQTMTLAMSYSRENLEMFRNTLLNNHPVNESSPNWLQYRLSLAQMQNLRDVSSHWAITCAYDTRGFSTTDHLLSRNSETDITTYNAGSMSICRLYEYLNINNDVCEACSIKTYQDVQFGIRLGGSTIEDTGGGCTGLQLTGSWPSCSTGSVSFFGYYECYSESFSCTASAQATTQLWYVTRNS